MRFPIVTPFYEVAWNDIVSGLMQFPIWGRLGWQDVKRRYRRTVIGPFWATLSIAMFLGGLTFVSAPLFHTSMRAILPFLAAGFVTWSYITSVINEGCTTYASTSLITQLSFPYSVLNMMIIWRNVIVFFHNVLIVVAVILVLHVPVTWDTLLVIPGLLIVAANGFWITMVLGLVGLRFRDIPQLVSNLVQILFFATPIFWQPTQLGPGGQKIVQFNYVYHLIEVMRAPMLGAAPSPLTYEITIGGAVLGWLVAYELFARFRRRVPYWI